MLLEAVLFDLFDTLVLVENENVFYTPCLKSLHNSLLKNGVEASFARFSHVYFQIRDELYSEARKTLTEPHFNVRIAQTLQKLGYNDEPPDKIVKNACSAFGNKFLKYVTLDTDAPDVLQKLHEKYKLGLVSNFALPECCWKLLNKYKLTHYFQTIIISGEINHRKPGRQIFEKALEALNAKPSQTVFVGDTPDLDIEGPKNVGMKTILIQRKPLEEAMTIKPDRIIKNLNELPATIETC
jgi:putative hydrolase of the HAD superfamily